MHVVSRVLLLSAALLLIRCSSFPIIDDPSRYHDSRVSFLILHFTSEDFDRSLELLTGRGETRVSVHWLIPEPGDSSYPRDALRVYRLVPEDRRAWHAGQSYWLGAAALNASSIGIELVNRSGCVEDPQAAAATPDSRLCTWLPFAEEQIDLLIELATAILARHPDIPPTNVLGHGDVAPTRRVDPGPLFPWRRLYEAGIGAWYDEDAAARWQARFAETLPPPPVVQAALRAWGFELDETGVYDEATGYALRAFQMHFRQSRFDARADPETVAILFALLEKYRPAQLRQLLGRLAPDLAV